MKSESNIMHIPKTIPPVAIFTIGSVLFFRDDVVNRFAIKCAKFILVKFGIKIGNSILSTQIQANCPE
ncbi:MAG: hypothetical protein CSB01_03525, partial [Bacteroidia bacterium]